MTDSRLTTVVRKNTVEERALVDDQLNSYVGIRNSTEVVDMREPSCVGVLGAEFVVSAVSIVLVVSIARVGVFCHDVHIRGVFGLFIVRRILIVLFDPV